MKILIVEDNVDIADTIRTFLECEGYTIAMGEVVSAAATKLREFNPDCIIMDYWMPNMTPEEFVKEARERNPDVLLILMSGVDDLKEIAANMNIKHYVKKPFDPAQITEILKVSCETETKSY